MTWIKTMNNGENMFPAFSSSSSNPSDRDYETEEESEDGDDELWVGEVVPSKHSRKGVRSAVPNLGRKSAKRSQISSMREGDVTQNFTERCHYCRQAIDGNFVTCSRCPVNFCEVCLSNRHGESARNELEAKFKWVCPKCRGSCGPGCVVCCSCVPCRRSKGLGPSGFVLKPARDHGFSNVHDYLVHLCTNETAKMVASRKEGRGWTSGVVDNLQLLVEDNFLRPRWGVKRIRTQRHSAITGQTSRYVDGASALNETADRQYGSVNGEKESIRGSKRRCRPETEVESRVSSCVLPENGGERLPRLSSVFETGATPGRSSPDCNDESEEGSFPFICPPFGFVEPLDSRRGESTVEGTLGKKKLLQLQRDSHNGDKSSTDDNSPRYNLPSIRIKVSKDGDRQLSCGIRTGGTDMVVARREEPNVDDSGLRKAVRRETADDSGLKQHHTNVRNKFLKKLLKSQKGCQKGEKTSRGSSSPCSSLPAKRKPLVDSTILKLMCRIPTEISDQVHAIPCGRVTHETNGCDDLQQYDAGAEKVKDSKLRKFDSGTPAQMMDEVSAIPPSEIEDGSSLRTAIFHETRVDGGNVMQCDASLTNKSTEKSSRMQRDCSWGGKFPEVVLNPRFNTPALPKLPSMTGKVIVEHSMTGKSACTTTGFADAERRICSMRDRDSAILESATRDEVEYHNDGLRQCDANFAGNFGKSAGQKADCFEGGKLPRGVTCLYSNSPNSPSTRMMLLSKESTIVRLSPTRNTDQSHAVPCAERGEDSPGNNTPIETRVDGDVLKLCSTNANKFVNKILVSQKNCDGSENFPRDGLSPGSNSLSSPSMTRIALLRGSAVEKPMCRVSLHITGELTPTPCARREENGSSLRDTTNHETRAVSDASKQCDVGAIKLVKKSVKSPRGHHAGEPCKDGLSPHSNFPNSLAVTRKVPSRDSPAGKPNCRTPSVIADEVNVAPCVEGNSVSFRCNETRTKSVEVRRDASSASPSSPSRIWKVCPKDATTILDPPFGTRPVILDDTLATPRVMREEVVQNGLNNRNGICHEAKADGDGLQQCNGIDMDEVDQLFKKGWSPGSSSPSVTGNVRTSPTSQQPLWMAAVGSRDEQCAPSCARTDGVRVGRWLLRNPSLRDAVVEGDGLRSCDANEKLTLAAQKECASTDCEAPNLLQSDEFQNRLQLLYERPFSVQQLRSMWLHFTSCDKSCGHLYGDHHPDLSRMLALEVVKEKKLKLLRGFFFWLQQQDLKGARRPWAMDTKNEDEIDEYERIQECMGLGFSESQAIDGLFAIDFSDHED